MEFKFSVKAIFPGNVNVVDNSLHVQNLDRLENESKTSSFQTPREVHEREPDVTKETCENLIYIINYIGKASARAQNLQYSITSGERLQQKEDKLYVILDTLEHGDKCVVGILKMGWKKLFVVDSLGKLKDVDALCVMDFYVHESRQRRGFGKRIFDVMLLKEGISPEKLAVDRPSSKFVSFLCKHYNLRDMIPQPNNFAVFPGFFSQNSSQELPLFVGKVAAGNRHSFSASSNVKIDADVLFRKALKTASARPRSFNDIERCLKWTEDVQEGEVLNGDELNLQNLNNGSPGGSAISRNSKASGSSPFVQDAFCSLSKRQSYPSGNRQQQSSSWNLFGVPPPTYGS